MTLSLEEILALTGGRLVCAASECVISGVATLAEAGPEEAAFLGNEKYYRDYLATKAGLVLVPPGLPQCPEGSVLVEVPNPSLAFNALVRHFMKAAVRGTPGVHPTAFVDGSAVLDPEQVCIGAGAVVEAGAVIGNGCDIGPGCVIGASAVLGENCRLYARVVVRERCRLGAHVVVQPGAVIGSDGFGFLMGADGRYEGIDQVGIVEIGDHVDIGANTTIDRARFGRTVIGEGTKIDNLVQIGHNVTIGRHCIIVAQTGIAGSTKLGDYVVLAAQVGIAGHLHVGDRVQVAAQAGAIENLEEGRAYWGSPTVPFNDRRRQIVALRRLPQLIRDVRALKKKVQEKGDE
ncbi:MAG: UDP-3-O-(3-hydroxymyristoyl)glucosamine N-acyltransferase [Akkermansia sp.]|nr:UDP-3-O-(3-hydroxymyristoyl)glucosamine N-acyltransferase [Akkermansia sp.]MCD8071226.1 UDP-3-O-(3-hydroxymyristoyl)glucosamine N-acyltransferase [Akkermansiaceae bacterium]